MIRVLMTGLALGALSAAAAPAQSDDPAAPNPLLQCASIQDDQARLACFDLIARGGEAPRPNPGAAGAPVRTGAAPSSTAAESEAETRARRFGLPAPSDLSFGLFGDRGEGRPDAFSGLETAGETETAAVPDVEILEQSRDGDPEKIALVVDRVSTVGYGTQRFHMSNGQVWEVTGGREVRIPRTDGPLRAEVQRGAIGGYLMRLDGRTRAVRVRRVD